jgi:hypothetical protein
MNDQETGERRTNKKPAEAGKRFKACLTVSRLSFLQLPMQVSIFTSGLGR